MIIRDSRERVFVILLHFQRIGSTEIIVYVVTFPRTFCRYIGAIRESRGKTFFLQNPDRSTCLRPILFFGFGEARKLRKEEIIREDCPPRGLRKERREAGKTVANERAF